MNMTEVPAALHGQSLPATARQQSTLGAMVGMNKESSTIE
jgi:hypothetical protein